MAPNARSQRQVAKAISEFAQIPTDNELYASIEKILASYRANLESRRQLTPEEAALIMQLSDVYLKKKQEWQIEAEAVAFQKVLEAIKLLRQDIPLDAIAQTTGLSIEKIEEIRRQLGA